MPSVVVLGRQTDFAIEQLHYHIADISTLSTSVGQQANGLSIRELRIVGMEEQNRFGCGIVHILSSKALIVKASGFHIRVANKRGSGHGIQLSGKRELKRLALSGHRHGTRTKSLLSIKTSFEDLSLLIP